MMERENRWLYFSSSEDETGYIADSEFPIRTFPVVKVPEVCSYKKRREIPGGREEPSTKKVKVFGNHVEPSIASTFVGDSLPPTSLDFHSPILSEQEYSSLDEGSSVETTLDEMVPVLGSPNKNKDLTDALSCLETVYVASGKKWNALAVKKAITSLRQSSCQIKSGKEAIKLPGIGQSVSQKIDEILTNGRLRMLNDEFGSTYLLFSHIWGVGPATIDRWYKNGLRSLKDLLDKPSVSKLNESQKIGIKYYDEFMQKIPRNEVMRHGKIVKEKVDSLFTDYT
eukprot:TRINITY_DN10344_c0_g1_i1.p1 TRINITY_DN10344_c0_g1~~TRINITY_DN10344_c0_g1_i1.p1  ORF type:complete len:283 (+),score=49.28 TRINITY_DN10344_c0_g1_i1:46-894(+)